MNIVAAAIRAFSIEDPRTPLSDPSAWLVDTFTGGGTNLSGVTVNRKTALTFHAFYRGVTLIARDAAKLPIFVYKRTKSEGRERATAHPAYWLLRHKPNSEQNAFQFKMLMLVHALVEGNFYAYIFRNEVTKLPIEIIPLDPAFTYPVRENGVLWYITHASGALRKLPAADVIHVHGISYDGMVGLKLVELARESIGGAIGLSRFATVFYKNSARPSTVLEFPNKLKPEQRDETLDAWNRMTQGLDNAHKTVILEHGLKVNTLPSGLRDLKISENRIDAIREMANWLGLPPHKLGDPNRTSFNSLEQEDRAYAAQSIDPWLVTAEAQFNDKLLTETEKRNDTHFIEFKREALIQTDTLTMTESLVKEVTNGLLTINEARAVRNRPALDDPIADRPLIPVNISPGGEQQQEEAAPVQQSIDGDHRVLLFFELGRMVKRIGHSALRTAKRGDNFVTWIEDEYPKLHVAVLHENMSPVFSCTFGLDDVGQRLEQLDREIKEGLLRAAECSPTELEASITEWTQTAAGELCGMLLKGTHNGPIEKLVA